MSGNKLSFEKITHHNLQGVDCSKLEPYIYWGLVLIFATHQLHINKK